MRTPVLLTLALLLAGCTAPTQDDDGFVASCDPRDPARDLDAITPGCWNVTSATDHLLLWAHNPSTGTRTGNWTITVEGGSMPAGWTLSFSKPSFTLRANGTKQGGEYPDWAWTLATLKLGAEAKGGAYNATLSAGNLTSDLKIHVASQRGVVSGPGSHVTTNYRGSFQDSGEEFDDNEYTTVLGTGETVVGFDYGHMGLGVGEAASLYLPPALAYGYDNPPGAYQKFNGRWLVFDVELKTIQ